MTNLDILEEKIKLNNELIIFIQKTEVMAGMLLLLIVMMAWVLYMLYRGMQDKALQVQQLEHERERLKEQFERLERRYNEQGTEQLKQLNQLQQALNKSLAEHNTQFEKRQGDAIKTLTESLQSGMTSLQKQLSQILSQTTNDLGKRMDGLTEKTDKRLMEIGGQVEKRLTEGFEKTTETFHDVLKRLALIDEAQKRITELSTNVVSLQQVLDDKRSRGAFGEVQLKGLVQNVMAEQDYEFQYTLPNKKIADCVLFLPEPTGMIAIDSKFPLESYKRMMDVEVNEVDRKAANTQFKRDIDKHIKDIADKYIIEGTTSDGAVMFIPAEAVFAEIQAHHADIVEKAHASRVWLVSPTTLWAILNTARAVLKDAATREQVHIIQKHLGGLSKDFMRFQDRMNKLATHIRQAHEDVDKVNITAQKITKQFGQIERVELDELETIESPIDDQDLFT